MSQIPTGSRAYGEQKIERVKEIKSLIVEEAAKKSPRWKPLLTKIAKTVEGASAEEIYLAFTAALTEHDISMNSDPYDLFKEVRATAKS